MTSSELVLPVTLLFICVLAQQEEGPIGLAEPPQEQETVLSGLDDSPMEGQIRLVGGDISGTGNLLIYHDGAWGVVCDDGWNLAAAHVVCHVLGFPNALGHTTSSYFGAPEEGVILDNVRCHGDENHILDCSHEPWGEHDCDSREAAGVYCAPRDANQAPQLPGNIILRQRPHFTTTKSTTTTTTTTLAPSSTLSPEQSNMLRQKAQMLRMAADLHETHVHNPQPYEIRLRNGRSANEGRVEVRIGERWGVICSDHWSLLEATVACKQAGQGYASMAVQTNSFGGEFKTKIVSGVHCDGQETRLSDCYHEHIRHDVMCASPNMVAGVVCSPVLPDLVPNATLLMTSTYLEDRPMVYMQCAMEENCASSSAYEIKRNQYDWHMMRRRLLRFSSSVWNFGTSEFRPHIPKEHWEWHQCHMHYHSMHVFANYDLLDLHGNRVAEGHKASFCLEDVECLPGRAKKFQCKGFGDQGISVGCADNYMHDIDCQWIDVTDVKSGSYVFMVHINPELHVAELNYANNVAMCNLQYSGIQVHISNCTLGVPQ